MNNKATFVKVRRILCISFSFVIFLLPQFHTSAKTIISNDITSDTTWTTSGNPYVIDASILVASSTTLTIDPGVIIKFSNGNSLDVFGNLRALGTATKKITITSDSTTPAIGDWSGIFFHSTSTGVINYATIRYADNPISIDGATFTANYLTAESGFDIINYATATLDNLTTDNLFIYNHSTVSLSNSTINTNNNEAIGVYSNSAISFSNITLSSVSTNDSGLSLYNSSTMSGSGLNISNVYDALNVYNTSTISADTIAIAQSNTGISLYNNASSTISSANIDCTDDCVSLYNASSLNANNLTISNGETGVASYSSTGNNTLVLKDSEIKNNDTGLYLNQINPTISNNSIHGNITYGAYTDETSNVDFSNNWWGSDTGPTHSVNTGGVGDVVSDYISYTPWLTDDPKNAGPDTYYALITNAPNGVAPLYDSPTTSGTLIKTVPNDFALKIVTRKNTGGNKLVADGFEWAKVTDPTDNTTHYTPYKNVTTKVVYLPYDKNIQTNLQTISEPQLTQVADRKAVILDAVDDYYNNASTTKSLFSSDDKAQISKLKTKGFPTELLLAFIAVESGGHDFNNEIVSRDYGHGIMQVTMKNYNNAKDTYNNLGLYSDIKNKLCLNFKLDSSNQKYNSNDYKKCYTPIYKNNGDLSKQVYDYYDDIQTNPIYYKQYSNTTQSIYANIKDGLGILSGKYGNVWNKPCTQNWSAGGYTFTCSEITMIKAIWGYNGATTDGDDYLGLFSDRLKNLSKYFKGYTYNNNDNLIEKLAYAGKHRIELKKHSPIDMTIKDSQGNIVVGTVNGQIQENTENSYYDEDSDSAVIFFPDNTYTYQIVGDSTVPNGGTYGLDLTTYNGNNNPTVFNAIDIPVKTGEIHTFSVDQSKLADNDPDAVTVTIDTNGDGTPERTVETGKELVTANPYDFYFKKIVDGGQYKVNKVLPVRIRVTSASKGKVPLQHPWIKVTRVSDGYKASVNPNKLDEDGQCDSDDDCFTKHHNRYILNIPKNTLTAGDWKIEVGLDNTTIHSIVVTMIK